MSKDLNINDPVFQYVLIDKLQPYIVAARKWWKEKEGHSFLTTSTFPIKWGPPGFYEKCTRSPRQSPIYGVQAFPIVAVSFLDLPRMAMGAMSAVEKIAKDGLEIDEFIVTSKQGLQSTSRCGLFLCLIPKEEMNLRTPSRWIYLKPNDILELVNGFVSAELIERLIPFAKEYRGEVTYEKHDAAQDHLHRTGIPSH